MRPETYARALSSLVGADVELHLLSIDASEPSASLVRVGLGVQSGRGRMVVGLEPALAGALLAKLLRRPVPILSPDASLDPALLGALSALLIESARRTGASQALVPTLPSVPEGSILLHGTAIVDGRPYAAAAWVLPTFAEAPEAFPGVSSTLLDVELALPLIVAENLSRTGDLTRLGLGAAWCPGAGWHMDSKLEGRGILAAGSSASGLFVELGPGPRIVLREATTALLAAPESMATENDDSPEPTLPQAVLDAPLVVRVELGAVSMKAREWAALRPGDVIETGRRIAEPVVLRAAGRVLAHGELVNVEGELGVRVTRLLGEGES